MYKAQVREDQDQAREFGISGVPFFIFNEKYALSGAQPPVSRNASSASFPIQT